MRDHRGLERLKEREASEHSPGPDPPRCEALWDDTTPSRSLFRCSERTSRDLGASHKPELQKLAEMATQAGRGAELRPTEHRAIGLVSVRLELD